MWFKQICPNLMKGYSQTYICADYVWNQEEEYRILCFEVWKDKKAFKNISFLVQFSCVAYVRPWMSADISGTSWDQCRSMVQHSFTSMETRRLVRTDSPWQPPQLSHSSWIMILLFRFSWGEGEGAKLQGVWSFPPRCPEDITLAEFTYLVSITCMPDYSDQVFVAFMSHLLRTI